MKRQEEALEAGGLSIVACFLIQLFDKVGQLPARNQIGQRVEKQRDEIASEVADVAILLFEFADNLGLNLGDVMAAKMAHNEARYPVHKAKGNNRKYSEL